MRLNFNSFLIVLIGIAACASLIINESERVNNRTMIEENLRLVNSIHHIMGTHTEQIKKLLEHKYRMDNHYHRFFKKGPRLIEGTPPYESKPIPKN